MEICREIGDLESALHNVGGTRAVSCSGHSLCASTKGASGGGAGRAANKKATDYDLPHMSESFVSG